MIGEQSSCTDPVDDSQLLGWCPVWVYYLLNMCQEMRCVVKHTNGLFNGKHLHIIPCTLTSCSIMHLYWQLRQSVCLWHRWSYDRDYSGTGYFLEL